MTQIISQRVKSLRKSLNLSQTEFADRIGYSRNYVSMVELGKSAVSGRFEKQLELIENSGGLTQAEGAMRVVKADEMRRRQRAGVDTVQDVDPRRLQLRRIPVYSFVQAGLATDFEMLPAGWEEEAPYLGNDPRAYGLKIVGDSMEPKYSPGDIAIVSPQYAPTNGDKVVARIEDQGVLFKVMHHSGDGTRIRLTSYNPVYPELVLPRESILWMHTVKAVIKV